MRAEAKAENVIPVLRGESEEASIPAFLRMRNWVDLRGDPAQESEVQRLLDRFRGVPAQPRRNDDEDRGSI